MRPVSYRDRAFPRRRWPTLGQNTSTVSALTGFLLALVGWDFDGKAVTQRTAGTAIVNEAIAVGNGSFSKSDYFVLASGDGSIRELPMDPVTRDPRMPEANIGRFAPLLHTKYLVDEEPR